MQLRKVGLEIVWNDSCERNNPALHRVEAKRVMCLMHHLARANLPIVVQTFLIIDVIHRDINLLRAFSSVALPDA